MYTMSLGSQDVWSYLQEAYSLSVLIYNAIPALYLTHRQVSELNAC